MSNDQYGNYQTPSSRPPEPPYRAYSQETQARAQTAPEGETAYRAGQRTVEPDLRGFDEPGNTASMSAYVPEPAATHAAQPQPAAHEAPAAAVSAKPASAGKTFLFGFLGALLACALCLGGYSAWAQTHRPVDAAAITTIGTTDQSVINAVEEGRTLAEAVAAKALPSVVAVYNYQKVPMNGYGYGMTSNSDGSATIAAGMGSGVLISDEGYILTNYHVVEDAAALSVTVGGEEREATYVGGDPSSDVAVIKIEDTSNMTVADIGNSDDLVIGEWVMTVGAPLGLEQSVATGVVSATNRSTIMSDSSYDSYTYYMNSGNNYTYYPNMIQTDAVINPGNSGGALVDSDGKLIGINTMISSYSGDYAGVGFAIPVNYAMGIAEQVIAGKEPTHAMLGVSISSVNDQIAQRYGLASTSGAYIASISEDSGAAEAGLKVGDIITAIDDKNVKSVTDVTLEVRKHNPGDTVTVKVDRDGEELEIPVVLSSDENLASSQSSEEGAGGYGNGYGNGHGYGDGYGYGNGNGSGTRDIENIEDLLEMLGF